MEREHLSPSSSALPLRVIIPCSTSDIQTKGSGEERDTEKRETDSLSPSVKLQHSVRRIGKLKAVQCEEERVILSIDIPVTKQREGTAGLAREERETVKKRGDVETEEKERRSGWGGKDRCRNHNRASVFRAWLLETYGQAYLASGAGVVDVAGGKGDLSMELQLSANIPSTIVDPRPLNLGEMLKRVTRGKLLRLLQEEKEAEEERRERGEREEMQEGKGEKTVMLPFPRHIPAWFDFGYDCQGVRLQDLDTKSYELASLSSPPPPLSLSSPPIKGKEREQMLEEEEEKDGRSEEIGRERLSSLLSACSMVVGMHPDQATEAIVDFSLSSGKPFAIVPCCVFPSIFKERRLKRGEKEGEREVRTYEEFIEYLREKCPEKIMVDTLDFVGRNTVLYTKP